MSRATDLAGVVVIAGLLAFPYALAEWARTAQEDRRAESEAARAALLEQRAEERRARAEASICAEQYGENAVALRTADGALRCATKRGHVIRILSHYPERQLPTRRAP